MAKGAGKSSASAGTRKKHSRKAGGSQPPPEQPEKKVKGKKGSKKELPRPKMYIPPSKPAPPQPDPLETSGLAHRLPPELLVVLRSLSKKATVTKVKALDDLKTNWLDRVPEDDELSWVLVEMVPVWLHHLPALLIHPSRRVRSSAATVHASFLSIPATQTQIVYFLNETATKIQAENILGAWALSAHDIDKSVSSVASKSWNSLVGGTSPRIDVRGSNVASLTSFVQRAALDPDGVYSALNPPAPTAPPTPSHTKKGVPTRQPIEDVARKVDETEEEEQDKRARIRVSALGTLRWMIDAVGEAEDTLMKLFSNRVFWSSLHPHEDCPFAPESFGYTQPLVRRSSWPLVQGLLQSWKGKLDPILPTLSTAILRSAWVETDALVLSSIWQPLLLFLKEYPKSWELDIAWELDVGHEEGDEESSEEEEEEEEDGEAKSKPRISLAYKEFLRFLELGCSGSPLQGYPAVVVILSTIPSSIFASTASTSVSSSPLKDLLSSFWAAVDAGVLGSLQRSAASAAFLSSLLECLVFLTRRIQRDPSGSHAKLLLGSDTDVISVLKAQFESVWSELKDGTLKVDPEAAAKLVAQSLKSLGDIDADLFRGSWVVLTQAMKNSVEAGPELVATFVKVFKSDQILTNEAIGLLRLLVDAAVERSDVSEPDSKDTAKFLVEALRNFRSGLFEDAQLATVVDDLVLTQSRRLFTNSPDLVLEYISVRDEESKCLALWRSLLKDVAQHPENAQEQLSRLVDAAQRGALPRYLSPEGDELDAAVNGLLGEALKCSKGSPVLGVLKRSFEMHTFFLADSTYQSILDSLVRTFRFHVDEAFRDASALLFTFEGVLELLLAASGDVLRSLNTETSLVPHMFLFTYLLPECYEEEHAVFGAARKLWRLWVEADTKEQPLVYTSITTELGQILRDTAARVYPQDILKSISDASLDRHVKSLSILPSKRQFDVGLEELSPDPIHASIAVLDPLIPPPSAFEDAQLLPAHFDDRGYSAYARICQALLCVFLDDRQVAKANIWGLRHLISLAIYAEDFLSAPNAPSPVFSTAAFRFGLQDIVSKVQQVSAYLLNTSWRSQDLIADLQGKRSSYTDCSSPTQFLVDLIRQSAEKEMIRETRVLRQVMQHVLDDADKEDADRWTAYSRTLEKSAPQTCIAILSSVNRFAPDPPRMERLRNELAASLMGIPPEKASTEGLMALQMLCACAPQAESDVVFMPQPRAVNAVRVCQQWMLAEGDEDEDEAGEDVESLMTLLFCHLSPILQNVPGQHWEFIFDMIENNLGSSSLAEQDSLTILARTLQLILVIEDLCRTNKSLRADWEGRKTGVFKSVKDLAAAKLEPSMRSKPVSICRELALSIVKDLPASLIDQDTLSKMCHLLTDSSIQVQQMSYQLMEQAAVKRTEHLVIEAGVDTEQTFVASIPDELAEILMQMISVDHLEQEEFVFGYLSSWMVLFDLFRDASLKVRLGYIDDLRSRNIISAYFMSNILFLLSVDQGSAKAFKLDLWAVDDFDLQLFEKGTSFSLQVFAAHVYYRALLTVPSMIHSWVLDCKDRQLSSSITTYTSTYFSPALIRKELAHVRSAGEQLKDDSLGIKVANAINEVSATYSVDEHQLEIKFRVPSDWPLHKIEIKDGKRVGVDESRWRAWILAVQQTIWAQNGRIVDGLELFKKNVTLHFEGQAECAICYSIISVMDGTLPKKPCRTCKNRFHAGCLYKWFNTSHSSSCPLCRSNIF